MITPINNRKTDSARLARIRHIFLDMDGTIYKGDRLFDWTPGFLATLERHSIGHTFLTNNSARSVDQYLEKLHGMGLAATRQDIYTSALATIDYLKNQRGEISRLYILGTDGLKAEFRNTGYNVVSESPEDEPDAVIVGFDTTLTFDRLCRAAYWIEKGKPYIATHPDRICPTDQPTLLVDCGAICAALSSATGRQPDLVFGKPRPEMIRNVMEQNQLNNHEVAMVGDRLYTDIEMARAAGIMGILVLSGETRREDVGNSPTQPDLIIENLGELGLMIGDC